MNYRKAIAVAALGALAFNAVQAAGITIVVTGATAFRKIAQLRAADILAGETAVGTINTDSYSLINGSIALDGVTYSPVNIHFSLSGSKDGMLTLANGANVAKALASTEGVPGGSSNPKAQVTFSDVFPETAGLDSNLFAQAGTPQSRVVGVVPFVFYYNPAKSPGLTNVANLTQRQVVKLFESSGVIPASYFGGTTEDTVYLTGRDSLSGTRLCTDSCTYFAGTPANYAFGVLAGGTYTQATAATAASAAWVFNDASVNKGMSAYGGHSSGGSVKNDVTYGPYAIGYGGPSDALATGFSQFLYNGVAFDAANGVANVANGRYEVWGYEHVQYLPVGSAIAGAPDVNQVKLIEALKAAIRDDNYQKGIPAATDYSSSRFVPLSSMKVVRSSDGGSLDLP